MITDYKSLRFELKGIWEEVGESEEEIDRMLVEAERECLDVYRRKVEQADRSRTELRRVIADSQAELDAISSVLGEPPVDIRQLCKKAGNLKEELKEIISHQEEMKRRKCDRVNELHYVMKQIRDISVEIRPSDYNLPLPVLDESNLSVKELKEMHQQLQSLQKEKDNRLKQISDLTNTLSSLCSVLGIDFRHTLDSVHPSLSRAAAPKNISNGTIEMLTSEIQRLREVKLQRMQKLQDLASSLLELWNLMDTPIEDQQKFQNVTCNIAASEHEMTAPNAVSLDFINNVEIEVTRLEALKTNKMKDLVLMKNTELNELCRQTHLLADSDEDLESAIEAAEAGEIDPILGHIEFKISTIKELAFSRKEIIERVEKWLSACEEESWLEEYNRDQKRFSGKGAHLILKRAEKARASANKIPSLVEALIVKTTAWEKERGNAFLYDGIMLLSMLEDYTVLREEKEQERKRHRDLKKLHGQLIVEQEVLYGSKASPIKSQGVKKGSKTPNGPMTPNKRNSFLGANLQLMRQESFASASSGSRGISSMPTSPRQPFIHLVNQGNNGMPSASFKLNSGSIEDDEVMSQRSTEEEWITGNKSSRGGIQVAITPSIRQTFKNELSGERLNTHLKREEQVSLHKLNIV